MSSSVGLALRGHHRDDLLPQNSSSSLLSASSNAPLIVSSPCEAASKASLTCLARNNYDRDACLDYFQAYRDCKSSWINQRKDDRRAGRT
ncbi:hypothetical protein CPB85DRAFT_1212478 [Mucidula mucida]|nr:hypothetical protein CPB85DRAFT_1212478 [Mucidula mucida]